MAVWKEVTPETLQQANAFELIGKVWMLITAQKQDALNTMTASWGGLGVMWGKNVAYVVIRPQRYTKEFVDASETFSLTFFEEEFREKLSYLGTVSGRDEDKIKKSALTVVKEETAPYFQEGKLVLFCKKLYTQQINPENFLDKHLEQKWYPQKDYHTLYIAEIIKALQKQ